MSRMAPLVVGLAVSISAIQPVAQACGDKFLMVGRGAKFQRAYASVYPGKLLIYAKPSSDPKAAIRDPQVHKALRQAGHTVSIIEDWGLLEQAVKTVTPVLEVRSRRVGGANYQVPVEVPQRRGRTLALRWLVTYARERREKSMQDKLAGEILDALEQQGNAFKRKDDMYRMAQANKAFAHYRW